MGRLSRYGLAFPTTPEITGDYKLICNEICAEHEKKRFCVCKMSKLLEPRNSNNYKVICSKFSHYNYEYKKADQCLKMYLSSCKRLITVFFFLKFS